MTRRSSPTRAAASVRPPRPSALARRAWGWATACVLLAVLPSAHAERADRDKPLQVEADRLEYDDLKQVNVFTGNVTLTKGTLTIRGDRVVVRQDPEGYQYGDAYGKPATFRQRRDGPGEQWIEGWGNRLEYDGKTETVRLHDRAALRRLDRERITDEVYGNLITYDSRSEFFTVDGGGQQAATGNNPRGRVRVVIQPRPNEAEPASSVRLQPAERIANPRPADPAKPAAPPAPAAAPRATERP